MRGLREDLSFDQVAEPARIVTVLGRDRAVGQEHAQEGNPGAPSTCDARLVVANGVVRRPRPERQERGRKADCRPFCSLSPSDGHEQRHEDRRKENLVRGPDQHKHRDPRAERDEAPRRGRRKRLREEPGPEREPGREHGVARSLVEERGVGRVHDQERRGEKGGETSERERDGAPRDDRDGVEGAEHDLESDCAPEIQRDAEHERRERRAEDLERIERRIPVEDLEVVREVVPGVPPLREGPAERVEPEAGERENQENGGAPPRRDDGEKSPPGLFHERARRAAARARASVPRSSAPTRPSRSSIRAPSASAKSDSASALASPA